MRTFTTLFAEDELPPAAQPLNAIAAATTIDAPATSLFALLFFNMCSSNLDFLLGRDAGVMRARLRQVATLPQSRKRAGFVRVELRLVAIVGRGTDAGRASSLNKKCDLADRASLHPYSNESLTSDVKRISTGDSYVQVHSFEN
jgi:hypothetical protein